MQVECPRCGETDALQGRRQEERITVRCERCDTEWDRDVRPRCERCESPDTVPAVMAIVEKGRGTQLSVVGTRVIHLCETCDAETIAHYYRIRPNPLMPDQLPTVGPEQA
jgi:formate dehydrogenase maturation protein FdhE